MKTNKKYALVCFLVTLIAFSVYFYFKAQHYRHQLSLFYSANIDSEIKSIKKGRGAIHIELVDGEKFVFVPHIQNYKFEELAQSGDRFIKPSKSDTVILMKRLKTYRFTFSTP